MKKRKRGKPTVSIDVEQLRNYIRDIPDYPKPGILFRDITPLLANPQALRQAVRALSDPFRKETIDYVLGTEARGFIFGATVALELDCGFIPVRKRGKLPYQTLEASYDLEYGTDHIQMHVDAVEKGQRVLVVDDLMATGGTAAATARLAQEAGAEIAACAFLIELTALRGRDLLKGHRIHSVISY
jgi:adenine phosphoribosyltransferase